MKSSQSIVNGKKIILYFLYNYTYLKTQHGTHIHAFRFQVYRAHVIQARKDSEIFQEFPTICVMQQETYQRND